VFAPVPILLIHELAQAFPSAMVGVELPSRAEDLDGPFIQVNRFGGGGKPITLDRAHVDIDIWHSTLPAAEVVAAQVAAWMVTRLPGTRTTVPVPADSGLSAPVTVTGVFAHVEAQSGMSARATGNPHLWRVGGAFTVIVHDNTPL